MFDLKGLGDITKIANQAQELQRQQDKKHQEQINLLRQIAATLEQILAEMKNRKF